ncbi:MAG: MFS transporter [Rubrivivax sp.]
MPDAPAAPAEPVAPHGRRKAAMSFILVAVLIDMIAVGVMVPVLPHIVGRFVTDPQDQVLGFLAVTAAFGVANFLASPLLGALSDRFGRRPILLLGFLALALSFFVTAAAEALWVLVVVRLFSGAMQANVGVAQAYVADITPPEQRARRFGLVGAMFGVGFILGPVVGGTLGDIDVRLPFVVAGALALLNFIYGSFVLPESLPPERRRAFEWRRANPVTSLRNLVTLREVGPLVGVIALSGLSTFMLHVTWVLYTKFRFGWGPGDVGWSLFAVGLASALGQGVLMKPLLARFSAQRVAVMGLLSAATAYAAWGLATEPWMVYAVIALNVLGGTASAALQSLVSNAVDGTRQGQTLGAVASLNSLMAVVAPLLGLEMMRWVSHLPSSHWLVGLPLLACACLQAAAALLAFVTFRRRARLVPASP